MNGYTPRGLASNEAAIFVMTYGKVKKSKVSFKGGSVLGGKSSSQKSKVERQKLKVEADCVVAMVSAPRTRFAVIDLLFQNW